MRGARRGRAAWRRFRRDQRGVSPVIGTVLVLFIVLLAMAGIMLWGVPAIQGLQEHAEFQSVLTQAVQMNAELRTLRDREAKAQISFSMNHGSLRAELGSRWVVTVAATSAYSSVNVTQWESETANTLQFNGMPAAANVTIDWFEGGTNNGTISSTPACNNCALAFNKPTTYRLPNNVTRIQFKENSVLKAETWIFDAGRLTYKFTEKNDNNRFHVEMGAVFAQQGEAVFLEERPAIKEPDFKADPKDPSYLIRVLQLEGNTFTSGKGRHTVQADLIDNYGITRSRPSIADAASVRIQINDGGLLEEAFCNHFDTLDHYTVAAPGCGSGNAEVLYDPPATEPAYLYQLNQGVVQVLVR